MGKTDAPGFRLVREDLDAALLERVADAHGTRVGLAGAVAALDAGGRRARRAYAAHALGLRVRSALTWDRADRRDPRWWPQGVTGFPDAEGGRLLGRRLLLVSWYDKGAPGSGHGNAGSRISVLDVDARRYVHVRLALPALVDGGPELAPLKVHAGGVALSGDLLHVAATGRGIWVAHLDDLLDVAGELVLPVRYAWRVRTDEGVEPLRVSFCATTLVEEGRGPVSGPSLLTGEYARRPVVEEGRSPVSRPRLVHWPLSPTGELADTDGVVTPISVTDGVVQMQGAVEVPGRGLQVTVSKGPVSPGWLMTGRAPDLRRRAFAVPMGPEDLAFDPGSGRLWTVTEHPRRRWVCAVATAD